MRAFEDRRPGEYEHRSAPFEIDEAGAQRDRPARRLDDDRSPAAASRTSPGASSSRPPAEVASRAVALVEDRSPSRWPLPALNSEGAVAHWRSRAAGRCRHRGCRARCRAAGSPSGQSTSTRSPASGNTAAPLLLPAPATSTASQGASVPPSAGEARPGSGPAAGIERVGNGAERRDRLARPVGGAAARSKTGDIARGRIEAMQRARHHMPAGDRLGDAGDHQRPSRRDADIAARLALGGDRDAHGAVEIGLGDAGDLAVPAPIRFSRWRKPDAPSLAAVSRASKASWRLTVLVSDQAPAAAGFQPAAVVPRTLRSLESVAVKARRSAP